MTLLQSYADYIGAEGIALYGFGILVVIGCGIAWSISKAVRK